MKFNEMSKGLRRRWRKRLRRVWGLDGDTVMRMTSGPVTPRPIENRGERTLDFEDGLAISVSPTGHMAPYRYDPEKVRKGRPAFICWME